MIVLNGDECEGERCGFVYVDVFVRVYGGCTTVYVGGCVYMCMHVYVSVLSIWKGGGRV